MKKADCVYSEANTNTIYSFYSESENSLDGVYLGSSAANRYWVPARAFENSGLCIYNMGTTNQPFIATKYLIKEVLKRQPNIKIIIIETRNIVRGAKNTHDLFFKIISDAMPYSENRSNMINSYIKYCKDIGAEIDYGKADYFFPLVRNKGAWLLNYDISKLKVLYENDYRAFDKGYMMNFDVNEQKKPHAYTKRKPINSIREKELNDLLMYCKTIKPEVVFVSTPYESNYGLEANLRYALDKCEEAGFETLDFNCEPLQSQIKLDWSKDFYNFKHLNTFGAVTYTDFLTDYLTDRYQFKDHRKEKGYDSWHKAVKHLNEEINKNRMNIQ